MLKCDICLATFDQKTSFDKHKNKKTFCGTNQDYHKIIEEKNKLIEENNLLIKLREEQINKNIILEKDHEENNDTTNTNNNVFNITINDFGKGDFDYTPVIENIIKICSNSTDEIHDVIINANY